VFSKEKDNVEKVKQAYEKEKDELLRQIRQLSYKVFWLSWSSAQYPVIFRLYSTGLKNEE